MFRCGRGVMRCRATADTRFPSSCSMRTCRRTQRGIVRLTDFLYGGDEHYRLCQEVILGIGGVRILRALGYDRLTRFHMNEGHAALLTMELLRERREAAGRSDIVPADLDAVRRQCVFTTHTPVPAGHDQFDLEMVDRVLGDRKACGIHDPICHANRLNMTYLALSLSHYINGVAQDGTRTFHSTCSPITRSMRLPTASMPRRGSRRRWRPSTTGTFPGWRQDNFSLRYALSISNDELWQAHQRAKQQLIDADQSRDQREALERDVLTLGFGRRAATYKRGDLVFDRPRSDCDEIAAEAGKLQIVFAGKAHPRDNDGKLLIQRIVQIARSLSADIPVVYLPNYDMRLAGLMTAGVDVWLNTPQPPLEASGTSGMKAAVNGVPSLSVLDGWWIEGCIEGITGWGIASDGQSDDRGRDAAALYTKLESCHSRPTTTTADALSI